MTDELRVVLFGFGYWGRNLARNVVAHPRLRLEHVVDPDEGQRLAASSLYPWIETHENGSVILEERRCNVAVVASPLAFHFATALDALQTDHHVLVTKPLAGSSNEAEQLLKVAAERDRILMIDHTFVYTGAIEKVRELVAGGELGDLIYCSSMRVNLGTYRRDSSVIWDLVPHDLSILDALGYGDPGAVSASAGGRMGGQVDQVAHVTLFYPEGLLAHVNVSWLAPVKMRLMIFGGTSKMVVYDDLEPSEKVKVYDRGVSISDVSSGAGLPLPVEYRLGDMWAPQLGQREALFSELSHLADCIEGGAEPLTGGASGVRSVRILEAASASAERQGELVVLDPDVWSRMAHGVDVAMTDDIGA